MKGYCNTTRIQGTIPNRFFLMVLFILVLCSSYLYAEARHALVIGNGNYEDLGVLKNPANDATDMAGALANLGFEVQTLIDADVVSMEEAIVRFGQRLSGSVDSVGFFFYAGHGVQHNGSNYLIPAGAKIASEVFLRTRSISAQAVLDTMQAAGNRLNIVVLDACRNNPFGWARSGQRGLSVVASQPPGSIIAYATSAGSVAGDGDGRNGIFTAELLRILAMPGIDVSELFRLTGLAVQERTAGRQVPAIYSQFFGKKTLFGGQETSLGENVSTPTVQLKAPMQSATNEATGKAELFIESNLLGADIVIDGKAKGKTPVFLDDVMPGAMLVVEARLGTMSAIGTYRVVEGFNELTMVLEQEKGNLIIQNCEADAELYIDGQKIGTVGSGLVRDVDAGNRTVEIRVPGRTAVHVVQITAEATARLIAKFEGNPYTVSFDSQGGSELSPRSKSVAFGQTYGTLPTVTRTGYDFDGWWAGTQGTGTQIHADSVVSITNDLTLYAKWNTIPYIGPSGGYIFYDKGNYRDGWRYLEAAPAGWSGSAEDPRKVWGGSWTTVGGTGTAIGTGKSNTDKIVAKFGNAEPYEKKPDYAAKLCADYRGGGHDDWFLPSKDELNQIYSNLYLNNLGSFSDGYYWSSSESYARYAWHQYFDNGYQCNDFNGRFRDYRVRPVRAF